MATRKLDANRILVVKGPRESEDARMFMGGCVGYLNAGIASPPDLTSESRVTSLKFFNRCGTYKTLPHLVGFTRRAKSGSKDPQRTDGTATSTHLISLRIQKKHDNS